ARLPRDHRRPPGRAGVAAAAPGDPPLCRGGLLRPRHHRPRLDRGDRQQGGQPGRAALLQADLQPGQGRPGRPPRPRRDPAPGPPAGAAGVPHRPRRFFAELGLPARIFPSYGATEAKVPEIVDAVVDLTETGSTLRSHGMVVIATLLTSFTEVVANPEAAADPERRQAMDDLLTLLVGAATARSKVLIKLNVAEADLARVLAVLPSMKAPTVNELADSGFHAVDTVVDKAGV